MYIKRYSCGDCDGWRCKNCLGLGYVDVLIDDDKNMEGGEPDESDQ